MISIAKCWSDADQRHLLLKVCLGWTLNWLAMLTMLFIFWMYVCELSSGTAEDGQVVQSELLVSWGWVIIQRVLLNEPLVIIMTRALPILLHSRICACLFTESCVEYLKASPNPSHHPITGVLMVNSALHTMSMTF